MYNRDFSGIRSDGQLYNLQREENQSYWTQQEDQTPQTPQKEHAESPSEKPKGLLGLDIFHGLKTDDLILLGIALLLLTDSDGSNDLAALLIMFLLLN